MSLKLSVEEAGNGVTLLSVEGEVDLNSSPQLRAAMAPHLNKKKSALIVDLEKVAYMDSSGIATLVEAMKIGQKNKVKFKIASPSAAVTEVFKMAHLEKVFEVCASREEALEGL
jgi:anti-sigma B factor antagonist